MAQLTDHFRLEEFGTDIPAAHIANVKRLATQLEILRAHIRRPIVITSGWRSPEHNARVGGTRESSHLTGSGADIVLRGTIPWSPLWLAGYIEALIAAGIMHDGGLGIYAKHVHYDLGAQRRWIDTGLGLLT